MGPWGALIMSFFGSVFFALAVRPYHPAALLYAVPLAIAMLGALAAWRILRREPSAVTPPTPPGERIITWATIGEGVGIPIVATVLANTGHGDAVLCGIALVVGLHFVPMAYAIPFRPIYTLAAALLLAAVAGLFLRQPLGSLVAGLGAAAVLWVAALAALRRSTVR